VFLSVSIERLFLRPTRALGAIIISLMMFLFRIGIHFDFSNRAIKDLWLTNPGRAHVP
jgi:hypothetical protein